MAKKKVENVVEMEQTEVKADKNVIEIPALTLDDFKEKVTIKERIGFVDKQAIIQLVYDGCVVKDEENGIYYIDSIMQDVNYRLAILGMYTNYYDVIEYATNYSYDYLNEIGVFSYVLNIVDADVLDIYYAIDNFKSRVKSLNSVGACLYRTVDKIVKDMPTMKDLNKLINNLPKLINGVDKDVLKIFAGELKNGNVTNKVIEKDNSNIVDITSKKKNTKKVTKNAKTTNKETSTIE